MPKRKNPGDVFEQELGRLAKTLVGNFVRHLTGIMDARQRLILGQVEEAQRRAGIPPSVAQPRRKTAAEHRAEILVQAYAILGVSMGDDAKLIKSVERRRSTCILMPLPGIRMRFRNWKRPTRS